jgi:hypothetical protein
MIPKRARFGGDARVRQTAWSNRTASFAGLGYRRRMARFLSSALLCLLAACETHPPVAPRPPPPSGSASTATPQPAASLEPLPAPAPNLSARRLPARGVKLMAFNRRGDRLAAIEALASGWRISLWNLVDGAKVVEIPVTGASPQGYLSWCFSDQAIAWHELVVGADGVQRSRIAVHRTDDGDRLGAVDPGENASCHQGSERLAVVGDDRVTIWDGSMRAVQTIAVGGDPRRVAWHPRGTELALSRYIGDPDPSSSRVDLWPVDGSAPSATHAVDGAPGPLSYSRDGQRLAWAEVAMGGIASATLALRSPDGTVVRSAAWQGHVDELSFSPDGAWLLTTSTAVQMALFDGQGASLASELPNGVGGTFSTDSHALAILMLDDGLRRFDIEALVSKGIASGRDVPLERRSGRRAIAVDPSHRWLAIGDESGIDVVAMP